MPVPLPPAEETKLQPPDAAEVELLSRGIITAVAPSTGLSQMQRLMIAAVVPAMTGYDATFDAPPLSPADFAAGLRARNVAFRTRMLQMMIFHALLLRPLPPDVAERIGAYAHELCVDDGMLAVAQELAAGSLGLAAADFDRNGYTASWPAEDHSALHASIEVSDAWEADPSDPDLHAQWSALEQLPRGTLGRRVTEFYRARGFVYPGHPGSAPPLLAQHDWVHVLADYGSTVESELEVFGFIMRANDDMHAFSLFAMVVSLFETGYLSAGAGLFEASPGHLSHDGMATRVGDALRRGALCPGSVDFLRVDWFELAHLPIGEARAHFGVVPKSAGAIVAGSVGPWEPGGISPYQLNAGEQMAAAGGVLYDSFGASVGS
jgi:hypothetical protein